MDGVLQWWDSPQQNYLPQCGKSDLLNSAYLKLMWLFVLHPPIINPEVYLHVLSPKLLDGFKFNARGLYQVTKPSICMGPM